MSRDEALTRIGQAVTREVLGGPPVKVGTLYAHPEHGTVIVESGQWLDPVYGRLSNWWTWRSILTGEVHSGYADRWPEADYLDPQPFALTCLGCYAFREPDDPDRDCACVLGGFDAPAGEGVLDAENANRWVPTAEVEAFERRSL